MDIEPLLSTLGVSASTLGIIGMVLYGLGHVIAAIPQALLDKYPWLAKIVRVVDPFVANYGRAKNQDKIKLEQEAKG